MFTKAKQAKEETNKQVATEKINLKITTAQVNNYAEKQEMITLKELSLVLKNDNEIEYVTEKTQVASTKYEVGEDPKSIFTKLKDYPYEFEINGLLELSSINGEKNVLVNDSKSETTLWENPNTNVAFQKQTIKIDNILQYNKIAIICKSANTVNEYEEHTMPIIDIGCRINIQNSWIDSSNYSKTYLTQRYATIVAEGLEFSNGKSNMRGIDDEEIIPVRILGYK